MGVSCGFAVCSLKSFSICVVGNDGDSNILCPVVVILFSNFQPIWHHFYDSNGTIIKPQYKIKSKNIKWYKTEYFSSTERNHLLDYLPFNDKIQCNFANFS